MKKKKLKRKKRRKRIWKFQKVFDTTYLENKNFNSEVHEPFGEFHSPKKINSDVVVWLIIHH